MRRRASVLIGTSILIASPLAAAEAPPSSRPPAQALEPPQVEIGPYLQEVSRTYGPADGLPAAEVTAIAAAADGTVYAGTARGLARFDGEGWHAVTAAGAARVEALAARGAEVLAVLGGSLVVIRDGERVSTVPLAAAVAPGGTVHAVAPVQEEASGREGTKGREAGTAHERAVYVGTEAGLYRLEEGELSPVEELHALLERHRPLVPAPGERAAPGAASPSPRAVLGAAAGKDGALAVAARAGLFARTPGEGGVWEALHPADGTRRWAPADVRAVAFEPLAEDGERLWFASPQGLGRRDPGGEWRLYTGLEGLPYDDFTAITAAGGARGGVWLGTRLGAIRFDGERWEYRQGRRWLPDDHVRAVASTAAGDAWFATPSGAGRISLERMTLAEKARRFEAAIDRHHRRTPFGFVDSAILARPGDRATWENRDSDNDGLWTSMYGAGECLAWAATGDPASRHRARQAFEALRFLGEVTQGGKHAPPRGFVARTILPGDGPDPNAGSPERDRRFRDERDGLWKVLDPRWPKSADGRWYWKADTSSDELDGHYFFYALYHDLVAGGEEEKARVREVVAGLTDHLIAHDFDLIDHDGRPTRWARFGPRVLNHDPIWWEERGLNSLSVLSYLKVAERVTGAAKYREAARSLIEEHGYAMNLLYPKSQSGPGTGNQSDDEMAFMSYYNLIRYETDPELRSLYASSFHRYWKLERPELNPLFNFLYAAVCRGESWDDAFGAEDLSPGGAWLEESVETLRRYPLERCNWSLRNSHRKDLVLLPPDAQRGGAARGHRRDGTVLPIDERFVEHWNHDPWVLDQGGDGNVLADGASFLLPYYLGLHHGLLRERR
jgi:hypothetical protein